MSARQYWTLLREDRLLIGSVIVLCVVAAAVVAALLPREYTSNATFYVASQQTTTSQSDSYQGAQLSSERVKSYTELLTGPRVAADASALLGGHPTTGEIQSAIGVDAVSETVVLNVGVTERSPEQAQLVAQAVTTSFTRLVGSLESAGQPVNRPIVATEVIFPPDLPTFSTGPGTAVLAAAGLLVGILLGVGAALSRRALRRAIDTPDALRARLGAPMLGVIPAMRRRPRHPALVAEPPAEARGRAARQARTRAAAVRRLRTAVCSVVDPHRCVVVTGLGSGHGASTTAVDLATALAAAGRSVLLVDAHLRRPAVAAALGLDGEHGLADVLEERTRLDEAVQHWGGGALDVLTTGGPAEHPSELLASPSTARLLATLRARYDHVLLDAPPITAYPDAVDLARVADGVLLVARRGEARPDDVDASVGMLRVAGGRLLGAVMSFAIGVPSTPAPARTNGNGNGNGNGAHGPASEDPAPSAAVSAETSSGANGSAKAGSGTGSASGAHPPAPLVPLRSTGYGARGGRRS